MCEINAAFSMQASLVSTLTHAPSSSIVRDNKEYRVPQGWWRMLWGCMELSPPSTTWLHPTSSHSFSEFQLAIRYSFYTTYLMISVYTSTTSVKQQDYKNNIPQHTKKKNPETLVPHPSCILDSSRFQLLTFSTPPNSTTGFWIPIA